MKTICSSLCTLAWLLSINLKVGNISMWNRNFLCLRSDYLSNYFTLLVLFQFFCVSEISVVGLICELEGRVNVQLFNGYSLTETGEVVGGERVSPSISFRVHSGGYVRDVKQSAWRPTKLTWRSCPMNQMEMNRNTLLSHAHCELS